MSRLFKLRTRWWVLAILYVAPAVARAAIMGNLRGVVPVAGVDLAFSPTQPIVYVTVTSSGQVVAVRTDTLQVTGTASVGSRPWGVAVSADGSRLYAANSGEKSVSIIDAATMTEVQRIVTPYAPADVAVAGSKLYLSPYQTGSTTFGMMVDLPTSAVSLFDARGAGYDAALVTSPDGRSLYLGSRYLSPVGLRLFDISGGAPQFVTAGSIAWGSNGKDLAVSHDGRLVVFPCGSGNDVVHQTAKVNATDLEVLGQFNVGLFPNTAAFAADDSMVFMDDAHGLVKVFDVASTALIGSFQAGTSSELLAQMGVDPSGRGLFVEVGGEIRVFETGVPEPSGLLPTLAMTSLLASRQRRRST